MRPIVEASERQLHAFLPCYMQHLAMHVAHTGFSSVIEPVSTPSFVAHAHMGAQRSKSRLFKLRYLIGPDARFGFGRIGGIVASLSASGAHLRQADAW